MSQSQALLDDSDLEDELLLIELAQQITESTHSTMTTLPSVESYVIQQQQQINTLL